MVGGCIDMSLVPCVQMFYAPHSCFLSRLSNFVLLLIILIHARVCPLFILDIDVNIYFIL